MSFLAALLGKGTQTRVLLRLTRPHARSDDWERAGNEVADGGDERHRGEREGSERDPERGRGVRGASSKRTLDELRRAAHPEDAADRAADRLAPVSDFEPDQDAPTGRHQHA